MSCWDILQLPPTEDERAIRRAYAKMLKLTRPDDDPEGYQRLREAFDEALMMAPYVATHDHAQPWQDDPMVQREHHLENQRNAAQEETTTPLSLHLEKIEDGENLPTKQVLFEDDFLPLSNEDSTRQTPLSQSDESDESDETDEADRLFVSIEQWYQQGGGELLVQKWQDIQLFLLQLSLVQSEAISWRLLTFITEKKVNNSVLWEQWSTYFNWHNDYRIQYHLNETDIELLHEHLSLAALYHPIPQRFTEYPLFHAFLMRINQGYAFWANLFYAFLVSPFLFYELSEPQRMLFERSHAGIKRLYDAAILCRLVFRGILLVAVAILTYLSDETLFISLYRLTVFGGAWILICLFLFTSFSQAITAFQIQQKKTMSFIIGILLPFAFFMLKHGLSMGNDLSFNYLLVLFWVWLCLTENIVPQASLYYLLMSLGIYFLLLPFDFYPLEFAIIWINFNLFLENYVRGYFIHLVTMETRPDWAVTGKLGGIFHLLRAWVIWFFLLPIQTLHWFLRYEDKGSLLELVLLSLVWVLALGHIVTAPLSLFYPCLFLLVGIQYLIKEMVLFRLKRMG
ncbi:hypothetical protein [Pasteurella sp. PK-2025]|uniref:hypothetical protein n=1 Tax=Pasteurella sp. PK-2025 TaxID=3413133 RepID=UPI003C789D06